MTMTRAEIEALLDRLEDCVAEDLEGQNIDFKEWGRGNSREQLQRVVRAAVCMAEAAIRATDGGSSVKHVRVRRGTLDDADAVRAWVAEHERKLNEAILEGPVIVE